MSKQEQAKEAVLQKTKWGIPFVVCPHCGKEHHTFLLLIYVGKTKQCGPFGCGKIFSVK